MVISSFFRTSRHVSRKRAARAMRPSALPESFGESFFYDLGRGFGVSGTLFLTSFSNAITFLAETSVPVPVRFLRRNDRHERAVLVPLHPTCVCLRRAPALVLGRNVTALAPSPLSFSLFAYFSLFRPTMGY